MVEGELMPPKDEINANFYTKMHKEHDAILKKNEHNLKVGIILLCIFTILIMIFPSSKHWVRILNAGAIAMLAITVYNLHTAMMILYRTRVMIMNEIIKGLADLGCFTSSVLAERLIEVTEKYKDKKARLDDLIGPDFEDIEK